MKHCILVKYNADVDADKKEKLLPEIRELFSGLSAIEGIHGITANDWSVYRQHLRDITDQPGFPFDIDWGTAPDAEEAT